jgi:Fic family protein
MALVIDSEAADANSRLTGIRLAVLTTRLMELWRRGTRDSDTTMILVAIAAITAERFTRGGLSDDQKSLDREMPLEKLAPCNVSSIAAATGLNRETARRRVNALVKAGALVRSAAGEISYPVGRMQDPRTAELVRKLLEAVVRFVNESAKDGVIRSRRSAGHS